MTVDDCESSEGGESETTLAMNEEVVTVEYAPAIF